MDEVRLAVQKEYEVNELNELYKYDVTHYDPAKEKGGNFVQHPNTFMKLKAESSRYPG